MLIYEGIKSDFMSGMEEDVLPSRIETLIYEKMRRRISKNEYNAWENSLQYMYKVLNDPHIPYNSGVAIEYNIPQTAKRIDFILSGYGEKRSKNAVVIELKQWDKVRLVEGSDALVETYVGQGLRRVVHPSYQAWSYCAMLEDYNANVQDQKIKLIPCAYLHNYIKEPHDVIEHPKYRAYLMKAPVFAHGDIVKLRAFIKKFIKYGDNRETLYLIDKGKIRPSKSLQDSLTSMLKGNREFIMLDEQKVVFDEAMELAEKSKKDEKKRVYIVKGGPGTGKSVVAVNLLAELTKEVTTMVVTTTKETTTEETSSNEETTTEETTSEEEKKNVFCDELFVMPKDGIRPVAVLIDNEGSSVLPQGGPGLAQVVYEIIVEGGITRLMPVYWGLDIDYLGPVRSARHYMLDYMKETDAFFVHYGWSPQAKQDIADYGIQIANGVSNAYNIFWDLTKDKNNWQDTYTSSDRIKDFMIRNGYSTETKVRMSERYHEEWSIPTEGKDCSFLSIQYSSGYKIGYEFNPDNGLYKRTRQGKPHMERNNDLQIEAGNIIIMKVRNYTIKGCCFWNISKSFGISDRGICCMDAPYRTKYTSSCLS
jgi:hypothetical protein